MKLIHKEFRIGLILIVSVDNVIAYNLGFLDNLNVFACYTLIIYAFILLFPNIELKTIKNEKRKLL